MKCNLDISGLRFDMLMSFITIFITVYLAH